MSTLRDGTGFGLVDTPENAYRRPASEDPDRLEGEDADAFALGRMMSSREAGTYTMGELDAGDGPG